MSGDKQLLNLIHDGWFQEIQQLWAGAREGPGWRTSARDPPTPSVRPRLTVTYVHTGQRFSLQVEKVLFHERSDFQVRLSRILFGFIIDPCTWLLGTRRDKLLVWHCQAATACLH
jgi:hypothetical protein